MGQIETSLAEGYQPNWGLKEAIREIVSTGLDGESQGKDDTPDGEAPKGVLEVKHYPRTSRLVVRNGGTTVSRSALLMGESKSRSYEECIGMFGEGLPLALLVLAREGYGVTIKNGGEMWIPVIVDDAEMASRRLAIKTRKLRKTSSDFEVEITGITGEDWAEHKKMFLAFSEVKSEDRVADPVSGEAILFSPELRGSIFNKGVLVTTRDDLALGYNFNVPLNRDRDMVDTDTVRGHATRLLEELIAYASEEKVDAWVNELMDRASTSGEEGCVEADDYYSPLRYCSGFGAAVTRWWEAQIASDESEVAGAEGSTPVFPVHMRTDKDRMERLGLKTRLIPGIAAGVLDLKPEISGLVDALTDERRHDPVRVYKLGELRHDQREILSLAMKAVKPVLPLGSAERLVRVVEFRDGHAGDGYSRKEGEKVYFDINLCAVSSVERTAAALVLALCRSLADDPLYRSYTADQMTYEHTQKRVLVRLLIEKQKATELKNSKPCASNNSADTAEHTGV